MTDTNLSSEARLREALAELRDGWRNSYAVAKANGAYGDNLVRAESCARHADLLDALLAAHPVGVEPVGNSYGGTKYEQPSQPPQPVQPEGERVKCGKCGHELNPDGAVGKHFCVDAAQPRQGSERE